MAARYNHLVQTGQLSEANFCFCQMDDLNWQCTTLLHDIEFSGTAARKRDAKNAVLREICIWYDTHEDAPALRADPDPGIPIYVLVDADSLGATLVNLADANHYEWLLVEGFANATTKIATEAWPVTFSPGIVADAADHYLTWRASQIVSSLDAGEKAFFVIVSRDAALQNTVELLKQAGHQALFYAHPILDVDELLRMVDERMIVPERRVAHYCPRYYSTESDSSDISSESEE